MNRLGSLALLCLLLGCAAPAPQQASACIPGDPGGSPYCQARTYQLAR